MATPRWVACVVCGAGCLLATCRSAHSVEPTAALGDLPAAAQPASQHPRSFQPDRLARIALLGDPAFRQPASLRAIRPTADGKQIITIGADDTIRFWDAATGKEQRRLEMSEAFSLEGVCFLPDGKHVLSVSAYGVSKIKVWDLDTGALRRDVKFPEYLSSPVVLPDGRQVFACGPEGRGKIIQFDLDTGTEIRRFTGHTDKVLSHFDVTPDGQILVTSSMFNSVRLWEVASGKLLRELDVRDSGVKGIAVAPSGGLIFTFCGEDTIRAWNIRNGAEVWQTKIGTFPGVVFSPDGKTFAAQVSDKKGLYFFDTASGKEKSHIDLEDFQWFSCMAFSRDGHRIYTGHSTMLCGYDVASSKRLFPADDISGRLICGAFQHLAASPDGRKLYSGTACSPVVVWDVPRGAVQTVWDVGGGVNSLDLAPDGRRLVVGDLKRRAIVLDTASGKRIRELTNPAGHYWHLPCWAQGGRRLVGLCYQNVLQRAGFMDGIQSILQVWNPDQGPEPRSIPVPSGSHRRGCGGGPQWVVCGGTGDWVVSAGNDQMGASYVYFISLDQGTVLSELTPGLFHPKAAALTPDDRTLVVVSERGQMSCWACPAPVSTPEPDPAKLADHVKAEFPDRPVGKSLSLTGEPHDLFARGYSLALHPDGHHWAAVAGRWQRTEIVLGELTDQGPRILRRIPDRSNGPVAVCFSRDGSTLFVGNGNTTIGVYREAPP